MHGNNLGTRPSGEMDENTYYTRQNLDNIDPSNHKNFNSPISIQTPNDSGRTTTSNFDPIVCGPSMSSHVPVDDIKPSLPADVLSQSIHAQDYSSNEIIIASPKTEDEEISEIVLEVVTMEMEDNIYRNDVTSPSSLSLSDDETVSDSQSSDSDTMTDKSSSPSPDVGENNIPLDKTDTNHDMESDLTEVLRDIMPDLSILKEDIDSIISQQPSNEMENIIKVNSKTGEVKEDIPNKEHLRRMYSMAVKTELRCKIEFNQVSSSITDDAEIEEDTSLFWDPNEAIEERKARNRRHARTSRQKRRQTLLNLQETNRQLENSKDVIKNQIKVLDSMLKRLKTWKKDHRCDRTVPNADKDRMEATGTVDSCQKNT